MKRDYVIGLTGSAGLGTVFAWFGLTAKGVAILAAFLALDLILGVADAYIRNPRDVSSTILSNGVIKKITRFMIPLLIGAGLHSIHIVEDLSTYVSVVVGVLTASELYSCIGHIYSINTKEKLPEIDALKMLLEGMGKLLKGFISKHK